MQMQGWWSPTASTTPDSDLPHEKLASFLQNSDPKEPYAGSETALGTGGPSGSTTWRSAAVSAIAVTRAGSLRWPRPMVSLGDEVSATATMLTGSHVSSSWQCQTFAPYSPNWTRCLRSRPDTGDLQCHATRPSYRQLFADHRFASA